jgi:dTDP-4-dehydrorhamnose reductase
VTRVLLLGVTGMLGGMVAKVLAAEPGIELVGAGRRDFDAARDDPQGLLDEIRPDWIVNAIGITKPHIDPASAAQVATALDVNARFPFALAHAAEAGGARVIQIATDGVFSGREGSYREDAPHDAPDVYGKTKSLGEVPSKSVSHLRCSVIGPEEPGGTSLLAWLLGQPSGARVSGYANQRWNGVTSLHFGKLCAGIIRERLDPPSPLHVVPADTVTKAELLELIADAFGREDIVVEAGAAPSALDSSLATNHPDANAVLWRAAGYDEAPTIEQMVGELSRRGDG